MHILLVRHALAVRRRDWTRPDALRPLTPKGLFQADGLIQTLAPYAIDRIVSSPYARCVETVAPLGKHLGLTVEIAQELAEGESTAATALIGARKERCVVLCSHGDVIPDLLDELAGTNSWDDELPFAKGSTWVVTTEPKLTTVYVAAPKR